MVNELCVSDRGPGSERFAHHSRIGQLPAISKKAGQVPGLRHPAPGPGILLNVPRTHRPRGTSQGTSELVHHALYVAPDQGPCQ
jgi:hypothetical protein